MDPVEDSSVSKLNSSSRTLFVQTPYRGLSPAPGFTLVELLVVIGIIALLIGILLPALNRARESAKRAACAAKLQQIMIAANIHVVDHKGFYPLAGELNATNNGQMTPAGLNDTYTSHYTYMGYTGLSQGNNGDIRILAPITYALGTEMGFTKNLGYMTDAQESAADTDILGLSRHFLCPSQASSPSDITQVCWLYAGTFGAYYGGYTGSFSYIFNEAVLGYDDTYGRLRGQANRVRQPSRTLFAMDGLGGSTLSRPDGAWTSFNDPGGPPPPFPNLTIFNFQTTAPVSLSDILTHRLNAQTGKPLGGDAQNFDQIRHRGKMNVAFCDGHVELRDIPAFTLATPSSGTPTFASDPTASGLSNIYLLAP